MTPQAKLVKIGAKMVRRGRYVAFQLVAVGISRRLFGAAIALAQMHATPAPARAG